LAELVAGEEFQVLIGELDVVALAELRRVPVLAGLGENICWQRGQTPPNANSSS
jgi:hypothetical protein